MANLAKFCGEVDVDSASNMVCICYLTIAGHSDAWGRLSGFGAGSILSAPDVRRFFLFTVPLVRAVSYSVGAYLSSLLYPAPVVHA